MLGPQLFVEDSVETRDGLLRRELTRMRVSLVLLLHIATGAG